MFPHLSANNSAAAGPSTPAATAADTQVLPDDDDELNELEASLEETSIQIQESSQPQLQPWPSFFVLKSASKPNAAPSCCQIAGSTASAGISLTDSAIQDVFKNAIKRFDSYLNPFWKQPTAAGDTVDGGVKPLRINNKRTIVIWIDGEKHFEQERLVSLLKRAVMEERFLDAAFLRDNAGAGLCFTNAILFGSDHDRDQIEMDADSDMRSC
ncbi:hypothetical protein V6N13_080487 [Hibiscus sabdariffa]